mgnify:CR=1 FL=1
MNIQHFLEETLNNIICHHTQLIHDKQELERQLLNLSGHQEEHEQDIDEIQTLPESSRELFTHQVQILHDSIPTEKMESLTNQIQQYEQEINKDKTKVREIQQLLCLIDENLGHLL